MSQIRKTAALASLTATYSDSESDGQEDEVEESGHEEQKQTDRFDMECEDNRDVAMLKSLDNLADSRTNSPSNIFSVESLASKIIKRDLNHEDDDEFEMPLNECEESEQCMSPISFHRSLLHKQDIIIPSESQEKCDKSLQDKIIKLYSKMKAGSDMNSFIQKRKDFRNPSIYEKLIAYCNIDEMSTNYPPEIYDPTIWTSNGDSFYEELAKRQKDDMEKRERERKDRTKVEFMTGTAKRGQSDAGSGSDVGGKKKTKWDMPVGHVSHVASIASQMVKTSLNMPSSSKPTVISAFGTISKKSK